MKRIAVILFVFVILAAGAQPAHAQESLTSVLSFLLVNRSVSTGDFAGDAAAAAAARDALVGFLQTELATLPTNSPASGFVYRMDPAVGTTMRVSDSFGPFFLERSLTIGSRQAAIGVAFTSASFDAIDGRSLRDGTLVSTASRIVGDVTPFDAETLTLHLRTQTATLSGTYGLGNRFDVGASVPFVTVLMDGERVDTYRGTSAVQASASASASGLGDVKVRGKYSALQRGASGIAAELEVRFPTGAEDNLLGTGETVITPRAIASFEHGWFGVHGSAGYAFAKSADALELSSAFTAVVAPRVTLSAEYIARRVAAGSELVDTVAPHPSLVGIETVRLTAAPTVLNQSVIAGGVRWNPYGRWLVSANVLHPLTSAGLTARWVASMTIDFSFGG